MAKEKVTYHCSACGYVSAYHMGKCPECSQWNTFEEQRVKKETAALTGTPKRLSLKEDALESAGLAKQAEGPVRLADIRAEDANRFTSGFDELDRVLGGGVIPGSYVLVGGDPGIGKSTLLLQVAQYLDNRSKKTVWYVAGEESPQQIRLRSTRLSEETFDIQVLAETNIRRIIDVLTVGERPDVLIIDSIQSVYNPDLSGTPGSVGQIRECAGMLMEIAKTLNIAVFLVGHVTKDGTVSGPKLLEHTVDAVLYLEGDPYRNLRILRTVKNRFGSTREIGVFEMTADGLVEVANPSELFLSEALFHNSPSGGQHPGSVVVATMEGTRPMLVELQALVGHSTYPSPRRIANGVEHNRLHQIVAVLERRLGLNFSYCDIYVNVVGGMRIDEPAADLAIALAIVTAHRNVPMQANTVVCGEIGLTGEIRSVAHLEPRIREAARIGFERMVLPASYAGGEAADIDITGVDTLMSAMVACLGEPVDQDPPFRENKRDYEINAGEPAAR